MDEAEQAIVHHTARSGKKYVVALILLLCLTALTFGLHFVPFIGAVGVVVALSIAAIKVSIVAAIFMELRESMAATRIVAVVCVGFLVLLCAGVIGDVGFR